ncbi:MAG TPA: LCP family protein [Acidimicrobiia bacterium]
MRRPLLLILAVALLASACSPEQTSADRPTTSSVQSTTTIPATTTTIPMAVAEAPEELATLVRDFYAFASGENPTPPPMPEPVLQSMRAGVVETPTSATASTGDFQGTSLATVTAGDDLILAVSDESGWRIVGGHWPSLGIADYYGTGPRVLAVIGSDARPGENVEQSRADSLHFVGLNGTGSGAIVGLPRDSYVPVPGHGKRKITGALALGGPALLMETLEGLSNLPLEGYVLTGFSGFQDGVDAVLGGVDVNVPFSINDVKAKAALEAGQQILNGFDALAFARARKTLPGGDLTRSSHQGLILLGAALGVKALGPASIPGLMEKAEPYLFTDLSPEQLFTFTVLAINADLGAVPNVVAPGKSGTAGGASVVFLSDSVPALFADLADGVLEN